MATECLSNMTSCKRFCAPESGTSDMNTHPHTHTERFSSTNGYQFDFSPKSMVRSHHFCGVLFMLCMEPFYSILISNSAILNKESTWTRNPICTFCTRGPLTSEQEAVHHEPPGPSLATKALTTGGGGS